MRTEQLVESMEEDGIDLFLVSRPTSIYYFTGTSAAEILVVSKEGEPLLLCPSYNVPKAAEQASQCRVCLFSEGGLVREIMDRTGVEHLRIGYDDLPLSTYLALRNGLEGADFKEASQLVWAMRSVKDVDEQRLIRRAAEISDAGMEAAKECLVDGIRENEVAAEAMHAMLKEGAEWSAFNMTVASGPRSAYPVGRVTDREIRRGEFVMIDMGALYHAYTSDITRTFIIGEPAEEQKRIYESVLEASKVVFDHFRAGNKTNDVDGVARRSITNNGYGRYFVHSLGHGIGLDNHEHPRLSQDSTDILQIGNVVSCEPGIYLPRLGGVRIEDTILVTRSDPERLTKFPKELDAMTA